ncbi:probable aspartic protease At2g35615 [Lotus japonicus]|uniref:probable aspartic protease At2g35615 n=1 Tax=Lotus japonicus TaxID=34305 RepID=UPI0025843306|nr:probable aspartic protease At2g35615 [Lotus japonicus]
MEVHVLALFVIVFISPLIEANLPNNFSIDLIHRDSPLSPFYNSSMNESEVFINVAMRSISRAETLFHLSNTGGIKSQAMLISNKIDYLMKFTVGNPPIDSFGIVDTGSDLIWIQCQPCEDCYKQTTPIFDPKKSSTYQTISCDSHTCDLVGTHACGASTVCRYEFTYEDKSMTVGELARDIITFGSFREVISPNTIFGCGHTNLGFDGPTATGLVGLGQGPLSLVSQLGDRISHKFSYCLFHRYSNITSKIKFGWEATLSRDRIGVVSVPLVDRAPNTFYHLSLKEIYVGKDAVETDKSNSDIIIDSGTTLTFLETSLYEIFELTVIEAYGDDREPIRNPPKPYRLCYLDGTTKDLPDISLSFYGANRKLRLKAYNVFAKFSGLLCLTVAPIKGSSVLGNLAQVNFKVLYDLQERKICDALHSVKLFREQDNAIRFLLGLNDSFGVVKSQILISHPLPSLAKVVSLATQHERQTETKEKGDSPAIVNAAEGKKPPYGREDDVYSQRGVEEPFTADQYKGILDMIQHVTTVSKKGLENGGASVNHVVRAVACE